MNRYTHSFLISSFLYGILFSGIMYMMSKTPRLLGENVIKISMVEPQEELTKKQIAKNEPVKQKVEDEPVQKIEKTKTPLASRPTPIKQPEVSTQKTEQGKTDKQQKAQIPNINVQAERNQFLSQLKSDIRRNKHYPEAARRRGQEGAVEVSFRVDPNGCVSNVICNGEHSVLNSAAKDAIINTFPVKVPQNIINTLPLEVSLVLDYKLD